MTSGKKSQEYDLIALMPSGGQADVGLHSRTVQ